MAFVTNSHSNSGGGSDSNSKSAEEADQLKELMASLGFSHYGWAAMEKPLSIAIYRQWLKDGLHASMAYLERHADIKENPQAHPPFQAIRGAIVIAKPYFPHPYRSFSKLKALRLALYAQGEDYHLRFKSQLEDVARRLREFHPDQQFLCYTDSAPILERDLAYRAGLGWFGKNTCLIHPRHGSLFFIGQILTTLEAPPHAVGAVVSDACGTCRRCLDACPTGALEGPRRLNSAKCISYWTIEAREAAPEDLRRRFGDWFFGCDICQTVCPWNEKKHGRDILQQLARPTSVETSRDVTGKEQTELIEELRWILNAGHRELTRALGRSPVSRAKPVGLKRNALTVIANLRLRELRDDVLRATDVPDLKQVASWTLAQLA